MNNFYIYVYLDSRKPGKHCYDNICFLYEPIYIGKGKNDRWKVINGRTPIFINKFNKIKKYGLKPIVIKLYENLNENLSLELEKKLIIEIDKINPGILINMTSGGEGTSGYIHTDETKKRLSEIRKNKQISLGQNNPMFDIHRFGNNAPHFGKKHSEESKIKISENRKGKNTGKDNHNFGKHLPKETRNKISEKHKGKYISQETKVKLCEKRKNKKGNNSPNHKLTEQQVIQIKILLKEGNLTQQEIADMFGVSSITISKIKTGKIWSHIKLGEN